MENAYRGEATVDLGNGERRALRYTWSAITELRTTLGEEWEAKINQAMVSIDLGTLALVLSAGLREAWADVSAEAVMCRSPPIADASTAIRVALHRAFFGGETPEEVAAKRAANPLQKAKTTIGKIASWLRSKARLQPA